jgi:hypothetical protein
MHTFFMVTQADIAHLRKKSSPGLPILEKKYVVSSNRGQSQQ